ncbi:MAG: hypothetical protein JWQ13_551 [Ramlibacter sp.]|jgi:hypothetical protein|nr:hypothetical protein [Ramlibacter sp.]
MNMGRRLVVGSGAALLFGSPRVFAQTPAPAPGLRSIAVLQIELLDDQNNPATKAAQEVRLREALLQLREELRARSLYRVVDPGPTQPLQDKLRAQQEFFYRCDDCAAQVGQQLGVDLVMTPWVQKVSELILNFNVQIFGVPAGKVIFSKSVDMRGNDDESWKRAVRYLVRDMAEKRTMNPKYGQ